MRLHIRDVRQYLSLLGINYSSFVFNQLDDNYKQVQILLMLLDGVLSESNFKGETEQRDFFSVI